MQGSEGDDLQKSHAFTSCFVFKNIFKSQKNKAR